MHHKATEGMSVPQSEAGLYLLKKDAASDPLPTVVNPVDQVMKKELLPCTLLEVYLYL